MREFQGDRVIVYKHAPTGERELSWVMTMVRVVEPDKQALHLTNRESKRCKPDWPLTQALFDALRPAGQNKHQAKWEITVKSK